MLRRLSSSCRQFRHQHAEFVDGCLSDEAQRAGRAHLDECPVCARHDVQIRRSLMALQSLPMIEPSAGFRDRLYERLAREELHYSPVPARHVRWGMAAAIVAASAALLFAASSRPRPSDATGAVPVMALAPARPAPQRPAPGGTVVLPIASPSGTSATTVPRSRARFEALPGQRAVSSGPLLPQGATVRLQTVSYIGQ
jgi:anti-sigma factor RsiW